MRKSKCLLCFLIITMSINGTSEHPYDNEISKKVTKCCPIDHSISIFNKTIKCVPNYTHSEHWNPLSVAVSMKKGDVIAEKDNTTLNIIDNVLYQETDGKKTKFYREYCADYDQDNVYMAIIPEILIEEEVVPVNQTFSKCCPRGERLELDGLLRRCVPSNTHSAYWDDYPVLQMSMQYGRIIKETDGVILFDLGNGTLMVEDSEANSTDFYHLFCLDHDREDNLVSILKDFNLTSIKNSNSLSSNDAYLIHFCFQIVSIGFGIRNGFICMRYIYKIGYKSPTSCLGYAGVCFSVGSILDGFHMPVLDIFSNTCYIIATMLVYGFLATFNTSQRFKNQQTVHLCVIFVLQVLSLKLLILRWFDHIMVIGTFFTVFIYIVKFKPSYDPPENNDILHRTILFVPIFMTIVVFEEYYDFYLGYFGNYIPIFNRFFVCELACSLVRYLNILKVQSKSEMSVVTYDHETSMDSENLISPENQIDNLTGLSLHNCIHSGFGDPLRLRGSKRIVSLNKIAKN